MSKIIRVYDAQRKPADWFRLLAGSQVAVFVEDFAEGWPVNAESGHATCEIFENLSSADQHCRKLVAEDLRLRCLVFDARGRGGDPIATYENPRVHSRDITGPFRRWSSAILITVSAILIWMDWRSDFERMWPSILAWKLLTTALIFVTWEAALMTQKFLARRGRLQQ